MKIVVVVQARMGSTRLPGKVMMPLAGKPLLQRMLERVRAASTMFDTVVATTTDPGDDPIRKLCNNLGVACYSGHPTDLLDRHCEAARSAGAETVVKIPSDCPLIDPAVIDRVLTYFIENRASFDYVSNLHPATYPDGNDVEVTPMQILETARREAVRPFEREHTTPFIWERPERFRIGNVNWETGLDYSMSHRWTIDYPEDYQFVKAVFDELWNEHAPVFHINDILDLMARRPDIFALNTKFAGVNWYRNHLDELKTISKNEVRTP